MHDLTSRPGGGPPWFRTGGLDVETQIDGGPGRGPERDLHTRGLGLDQVQRLLLETKRLVQKTVPDRGATT